MKAIHLHGRGGPDRLVYEDAPQPHPGSGEVLVRVHATSIIATELTWDETYQTAAGNARSLPIPGHDVSGIVEEVLHHLPCNEMQFLKVFFENSLLEPIKRSHFSLSMSLARKLRMIHQTGTTAFYHLLTESLPINWDLIKEQYDQMIKFPTVDLRDLQRSSPLCG